jgi:anaerobic selenocysteine-containing dehydrogenase
VIPGFEDFNTRVRKPRGFHLENSAAMRRWETPSKKAPFSTCALPEATDHQVGRAQDGVFVLQTFRSHDQYNTTIYGMDDRYRGVYGGRSVIFMNPADLAELGAEAGDRVDVIGRHDDGVSRIASDFRLVPYDIPRGCVAGYYPELNVLVPLSSAGDESDTPTSKSVLVSFRTQAATANAA